MNETRLRTIEQIEQFLSTSEQIAFAAHGDDSDRYEHISRVLKRFDFPQRSKRERGVLREYLQRTTGCSRAQVTRLVTQWHDNRLAAVPLKKRYRAPVVPFARKYSRRCMLDVEGPLSKSLKVAFGHPRDLPLLGFIAEKQSSRFRFPEAVVPSRQERAQSGSSIV